jgi:hypothetical protein
MTVVGYTAASTVGPRAPAVAARTRGPADTGHRSRPKLSAPCLKEKRGASASAG